MATIGTVMWSDMFDVFMRWLHTTGAIVAAGGVIFARFVMMPALERQSDSIRSEIHEAARARFSKFIAAAYAALLISGFYAYIAIQVPRHAGQASYHGTMGVKIILAFAIFFLGSALTGRSAAFDGIRKARKRWMGVVIVLAMTVVALGAVLREIPVVESKV